MKTINMTSTQALALRERVQQQMKDNGNTEYVFFAVSKSADHVLALQGHGIRCFLGISDDAELSRLFVSADSRVKGRVHRRLGAPGIRGADQGPLVSGQLPRAPGGPQARFDGGEGHTTPDPIFSGGLLLAALAGPVWLRDALMTTLARDLPEYETTLKFTAQATEDPAVLAPIAFAMLMGGNELAVNSLAGRIDDDTSLMNLVRQSLQSGQSHLISKQMITDDLLEASLRTGL